MTLSTAANNSYFDFDADVQCVIDLNEITEIKSAIYKKIARGDSSKKLNKYYCIMCAFLVAQVIIVCEFKNQQKG